MIMGKKSETQVSDLVFHSLAGGESDIQEDAITSERWMIDRDSMTLESLCGVDQRQKVVATQQMPYMAICKLYMKAPNGLNYIGSGWLVSGNKLYTAGHCVYNSDSGGWKTSVIVIPGKSGPSEPYGRYQATELMATRGWLDDGSNRYDMGAIKLDRNVSHNSFFTPSLADPNSGNVCGYPGDRDQGLFQYEMRHTLNKNGGQFKYFIDTYGGQSGCPVITNNTTGVGIHNYGGCPNSASDLYQDFIDGVANW